MRDNEYLPPPARAHMLPSRTLVRWYALPPQLRGQHNHKRWKKLFDRQSEYRAYLRDQLREQVRTVYETV